MQAKLTFLGTSASLGVPVVGCQCCVCLSQDYRDKRLRPACLLEYNKKKYLIDIGPDFRTQALKYHISNLNGVLITHTHYDHIAGLDDLRVYPFKMKKSLPLLASQESVEDLYKRFPYLFKNISGKQEKFSFHALKDDEGSCIFEGLPLSYFSYKQLGMKVLGFRLKNFAFVTDIKDYTSDLFCQLQGVDILVISALAWEATPAHIGLNEALHIARTLKVKKAYLNHIGHELGYKKTNEKLPDFFRLSYDGLSFDFDV